MSYEKPNVNTRESALNPNDEAVKYLRHLRPGGPWQLLAFDPKGSSGQRVMVARTASDVLAFVKRWNGKRNIYYAVNPLREYSEKKATKADVAVIEFVHFDLDPRVDETPEAAKKRYQAALAGEPELFALIDSGNGLNGLYRLDKPIPLNGDDDAAIADVEARAKALMERVGAKAGTQNIDRILRLPGTTNIPTKTKQKAGRARCEAKLISKSDTTVSLSDLQKSSGDKPKLVRSGNVIHLPGFRTVWTLPGWMERELRQAVLRDTDRSAVLHGFLIQCIENGIPYRKAELVCLNPKYKGCAIYEHCMEQDDPEAYLERQWERAEDKAEEDEVKFDFSKIPLTLDQWLDRDIPPIDPLIGTWLTTTNRVLLSAKAGLGKTIFLIDIGFAIAAGRGFLHWRGRITKRKVLYIDAELSARLLQHRLELAAKRFGKKPPTFFALCKEDFQTLKPLNTPEGQAFVDQLAEHLGAELIIFDNVKHLVSGSHKEEEAWAEVEPWSLSLKYRGIGQIWVHHTGIDASRQYGTSTREWAMDSCIILDPAGTDRTKIDFTLRFDKARESEPETRGEYSPMHIRLENDEWIFDESTNTSARRLSKNVETMLSLLRESGEDGLTIEDWNEKCRDVGLGKSRKADLYDYRKSLENKQLVTKYRGRWKAV